MLKIKEKFALLIIATVGYAQSLLTLHLEDLSQIKTIPITSTLLKVKKRFTPSSYTIITQKQIQECGARTLDEALEIYVPQIAYLPKVEGNQLGINGIISDRNNKILLLVNGVALNIKARDGGAITERFFPLLGDIKEIHILSGPGAMIYGPGAIAGVINIITYNAKTFQGLQLDSGLGYGEHFGYVAMKYGTTFANGVGLFAYAGIDKYHGVPKSRLKDRFAFSFKRKGIIAYEDYPYPISNRNGAFEDYNRLKLHLQLNNNNWQFWSRYTKSSLATPPYQNFYIFSPKPDYLYDTGMESDQWSNVFSYTQHFKDISIQYHASFIQSELEKVLYRGSLQGVEELVGPEDARKTFNENNLNLQTLLRYHYSKKAQYAFGIEYNRYHISDYRNKHIELFLNPKSWNSNTLSAYAEAKYELSERWMSIVDIRADKHTFTDLLFSSRLATIYKIDPFKTFKCNISQSHRIIDEVDLYWQYHQIGQKEPDTESIRHAELIYNSAQDGWKNSFKASYNIHSIVAYNNKIYGSNKIGTAKFYTLEGLISYTAPKYSFSFSHLFTKLLNFNLSDPKVKIQNISAKPYGYGSNFANWPSHITKMRFTYNLDKRLKLLGSLRIFWRLQGGVDMARYNMQNFSPIKKNKLINYQYYRLPLYEKSTKAFNPRAYLNLSLAYKINKHSSLYLHGYNLLGIFDENLNKRNYFQTSSNYFIEEPAFSIMLHYTF